MMNISTPVVLLRSVNHGGLAIARSLGRLGVPVYVVEPDPRASVFSSRYCRGGFEWDLERAPIEDSVRYLGDIGRGFGRRAILLPTADTTALLVAAASESLSRWFSFPKVPLDLVQTLHSKKEMHYLAKRIGIPTPEAYFPESMEDALKFAGSARYPIMLKTIEGSQTKSNLARPKVIVHSRRELLENYELMEDPEHPNVLFQEYIPGGEDANWMFNGYFDANSECLFGITGQKIRQWRVYNGCTSLGVCRANEIVADTVKRLMKTVGYRGILDIGLRYDARDGQYKVFDINPRIGCTFRLFVSDNGMDVARAMYLDFTGQRIDAGRPIPERKWMVEDTDLAAAFCYWRDRKLTIRQWLASFRGVQETAFFARDDLRPLASMCLNDFLSVFSKVRKAEIVGPAGMEGNQSTSLETPMAKSH